MLVRLYLRPAIGAVARASPLSTSAAAPAPVTSGASAAANAAPSIDFGNARAVFAAKYLPQLLRAYGVLRLCGVGPIVRNARAVSCYVGVEFGCVCGVIHFIYLFYI